MKPPFNKDLSPRNCNHTNKKILLFPDFSSTGVWCECGCSIGNPKEFYPNISEGLFDMIQLWNDYWDDVCFVDHPSYIDGVTPEILKYHQDKIDSIGEELADIISEKYQACSFLKERSKIFCLINTGEKE